MIDDRTVAWLLLAGVALPALALLAHLILGVREWLRLRARRLEWERHARDFRCTPEIISQIRGMEIPTVSWEQTRPDVIHLAGSVQDDGSQRCAICGEVIVAKGEAGSEGLLALMTFGGVRWITDAEASASKIVDDPLIVYCSPRVDEGAAS